LEKDSPRTLLIASVSMLAAILGALQTFLRFAERATLVLNGHAACRTQPFLYLKACGREELSTMNLWAGADMPAKAERC
jgi:hypothetical protein